MSRNSWYEMAYIQIDEDWKFIAELIPGVLGHHCMFKWFSLKKYNLANNSWTER